MATMRLIGADQLDQSLLKTETRWKNMVPPFKRSALILFASVKRNFSSGGRPTWKPLKVREGQPLRDTGRLMASVTGAGGGSVSRETHQQGYHSLEIGTNVVYANVHQFGFQGTVKQNVRAHSRVITQAFGRSIEPRPVTVKAHTRNMKMNIPARPFLLLQPEDKADIMKVFQEYLGFGPQK